MTVHILPVCRTCIGCRNQISAKIILLRNLIRFLLSVIKVHRCSNGAPLCARIHLAVQIGNQCMPQPHSFPAERKDIIPIIPRSSVLELIITAMQTEYRAEHPILYPSQKQFSVLHTSHVSANIMTPPETSHISGRSCKIRLERKTFPRYDSVPRKLYWVTMGTRPAPS